MARIQRLSTNLINKIAAGEVIERPGSVVKELMENSIDAGATRIDVVIERGGSDLIRIVDNGCGMDADDLILAVTSHATSKLRSEEDLFSVSSMGFRGEAMASVAEISQMTVRSRVNPGVKPTVGEAVPKESDAPISGMEMRVEGGEYREPVPCGCPPGTQIDVKNLFFNTPVRRKFLKSVQTEFGYISEYFVRLALANPRIHFTLRHNSRVVYDLPATTDWLQRICDTEGKELADALMYIESEYEGIRIYGYAARPNFSRSNAKMQFLFLNGRPIRDRALQHALLEAYRNLMTQGRFPIAFLKLDMPPKLVDVNVHPTKMEVRFQESGNIYKCFLNALRSKFLRTNMATYVNAARRDMNTLVALNETFRNIDAPENFTPLHAEAESRNVSLAWLTETETETGPDTEKGSVTEPRGTVDVRSVTDSGMSSGM
ncbi:MAG: DNA mismatch repair endonuclease MutL, partial [Planctomycetia bacterium]|nr:DNA mismatch repair endonuclease MutL [Planctomycetia bacterium]